MHDRLIGLVLRLDCTAEAVRDPELQEASGKPTAGLAHCRTGALAASRPGRAKPVSASHWCSMGLWRTLRTSFSGTRWPSRH